MGLALYAWFKMDFGLNMTRHSSMAISISTPHSTLLYLLLLLTTLPAVSSTRAAIWTVPPQIRNIIEALINAGNFGSWANVLHGTNPSSFPLSAILFIPSDDALAHLSLRPIVDVSLIQIPHQFAFYDLQQFQIGARISTLLPNKTIVITNNTRSNFTVDDSLIIHPDLQQFQKKKKIHKKVRWVL
ncbi:uncharacterized protein LOC131231834 [Magnolia sinica]|uniref:uncharacterized protein LOC131231834 n=1 Tax=Magnolia sinica TaxID=86752 RepID=UPI002659C894|nr:uncharacterized protein LOC131231834 [Magnolia sinica]